jgi:hypothetical protein
MGNYVIVLASVFVIDLHSISFLGLAGDMKKAMKDGKPIIIEVCLLFNYLDPLVVHHLPPTLPPKGAPVVVF